MRRKKKGYNATLSDDESEESEFDKISNFIAFTFYVINHSTDDSLVVASSSYLADDHVLTGDDDEISDDVLAESYKVFFFLL